MSIHTETITNLEHRPNLTYQANSIVTGGHNPMSDQENQENKDTQQIESEQTESELFSKEQTLQLGGYSPLPRIIRQAPGLSLAAKTVYALLVDYLWNSETHSIKKLQEKMCHDLGDIAPNTLRKYLEELKQYGLLDWERKGMPARNVYTLNAYPSSLVKSRLSQMRNKIAQQDVQTHEQQDAQQDCATNIKIFNDQSSKDKTTTLSTNQTTAGDRGLTSAEVGVTQKVEEMKINEFLDHAKEMIIDPMYRGSPRKKLTYAEQSSLTQLFIKQGWTQAQNIIDQTALKGRYGLDGLKMTMEDMGFLDNGKRKTPYQQFAIAPSKTPFNRFQYREPRRVVMNREIQRMTDDFVRQWQSSFSEREKQQQIDCGFADFKGIPSAKLVKLWWEGLEIVESNRDS